MPGLQVITGRCLILAIAADCRSGVAAKTASMNEISSVCLLDMRLKMVIKG